MAIYPVIILVSLMSGLTLLFKQTNYHKYSSTVQKLELPLTLACAGNEKTVEAKIPRRLKKKYYPVNDSLVSVYGKLDYKKNKNGYIIYFISGNGRLPWLYTYDEKGNILDSLQLISEFCEEDDGIKSYPSSTINDDLSIIIKDSTVYERMPFTPERTITKILVKKNRYTLSESGSPVFTGHTTDSIKLYVDKAPNKNPIRD